MKKREAEAQSALFAEGDYPERVECDNDIDVGPPAHF